MEKELGERWYDTRSKTLNAVEKTKRKGELQGEVCRWEVYEEGMQVGRVNEWRVEREGGVVQVQMKKTKK